MRRRKLISIGHPFNVSAWCEEPVEVRAIGSDGGKREYQMKTNPRGLSLEAKPDVPHILSTEGTKRQ